MEEFMGAFDDMEVTEQASVQRASRVQAEIQRAKDTAVLQNKNMMSWETTVDDDDDVDATDHRRVSRVTLAVFRGQLDTAVDFANAILDIKGRGETTKANKVGICTALAHGWLRQRDLVQARVWLNEARKYNGVIAMPLPEVKGPSPPADLHDTWPTVLSLSMRIGIMELMLEDPVKDYRVETEGAVAALLAWTPFDPNVWGAAGDLIHLALSDGSTVFSASEVGHLALWRSMMYSMAVSGLRDSRLVLSMSSENEPLHPDSILESISPVNKFCWAASSDPGAVHETIAARIEGGNQIMTSMWCDKDSEVPQVAAEIVPKFILDRLVSPAPYPEWSADAAWERLGILHLDSTSFKSMGASTYVAPEDRTEDTAIDREVKDPSLL